MTVAAFPSSSAAASAAPHDDSIDVASALTPRHIHAIAAGADVHLGPDGVERMAAAHAFLMQLVAARHRIYGVTTGYGPLAGHSISASCAEALQQNLLYHLSTGVGKPLSREHTRAVMAVRASNLAYGCSGVSQAGIQLLLDMLDRDVIPVVPEMGTVGASGDLTPLSHIALVMIGEGEAVVRGARVPGLIALRRAGLEPIRLGPKEGIALVNGTAAMTGIAAVNAVRAQRLLALGLRLGVAQAELLHAHGEAFDARFGQVRPHKGQQWAHRAIAQWSHGTTRIRQASDIPPVLPEYTGDTGVYAPAEVPQDPYTIRCLPQIYGAVKDVVDWHEGIVTTEINAATDNPLVFAEDGVLRHGGNFYGQHVAFASDALSLGVIKVALHVERLMARLCEPTQNGGRPAFLSGGATGLHSGFMGAQVTATSVVAEMRSRATAASIQSIPTNNDNQDVVTMGTIAARKAAEQLDLAWHVLAIHAMAITEAGRREPGGIAQSGFSAATQDLLAHIASTFPPLAVDRSLSAEIQRLARELEMVAWDDDDVTTTARAA